MKSLIIFLILLTISFGECTFFNKTSNVFLSSCDTNAIRSINFTNIPTCTEEQLILCNNSLCQVGMQCGNIIFMQHNNAVEIINKGIATVSVKIDKTFYNNFIKYKTKKEAYRRELTIINNIEYMYIFSMPLEILEMLELLIQFIDPLKD